MISIRPDAYYVSVLDIDARDLVARGYRAVLLDLDSTLQPRVPPAFRPRWSPGSNRSKDAGLSVALISNSARERRRGGASARRLPRAQCDEALRTRLRAHAPLWAFPVTGPS